MKPKVSLAKRPSGVSLRSTSFCFISSKQFVQSTAFPSLLYHAGYVRERRVVLLELFSFMVRLTVPMHETLHCASHRLGRWLQARELAHTRGASARAVIQPRVGALAPDRAVVTRCDARMCGAIRWSLLVTTQLRGHTDVRNPQRSVRAERVARTLSPHSSLHARWLRASLCAVHFQQLAHQLGPKPRPRYVATRVHNLLRHTPAWCSKCTVLHILCKKPFNKKRFLHRLPTIRNSCFTSFLR